MEICLQLYTLLKNFSIFRGLLDDTEKRLLFQKKYRYTVPVENGEMAERLNAIVLKTIEVATPPRVRIPLSPPLK